MKIYFSKLCGCGVCYTHDVAQCLIDNVVEMDDEIDFTDDPSDADIIIVAGACASSRRDINFSLWNLEKLNKTKKEGTPILFSGCLTKETIPLEISETIRKYLDEWNITVLPTNNPQALINRMLQIITGEDDKDFIIQDGFGESIIRPYKDGHEELDMYIETGCTNKCSFCKENYLITPIQSMSFETFKEIIKEAVEKGIKTINLFGQNLCNYGMDFDGNSHFAEILEFLESVDSIECINMVGLAVKDIRDLGIDEILGNSKKIGYIELNLESGSNRVLKSMNKGITREDYLNVVNRIRNGKEVNINTCVIFGYPGETPKDIRETFEVIRQANINHVNVGKFRPSYTPASKERQLGKGTCEEHLKKLVRRLDRNSISYRVV